MAKSFGKKESKFHFKINVFLQSHLSSIGGSQIEQDYKLVENEGLFEEYLEMSKYIYNNSKNQ